jgi:hypothetical protein
MMTDNDIEESLSRAYVFAVAGRAGVLLGGTVKDYGCDGTFHEVVVLGGKRMQGGFSIDFQLKASKNCTLDNNDVVYDLDAETHRKLIFRKQQGGTPIVLIVLVLPSETDDWLVHSEDQLLIKQCCYWCVVDGVATANKNTVRIRIPRSQQLTPEAVNDLLARVRAGTMT